MKPLIAGQTSTQLTINLDVMSELVYVQWMHEALLEAEKAKEKGEVPVGAVIILDGNIIGRGHNSPISFNDPSAHAEINALRDAGKNMHNYRFPGAQMFVTLEPCAMCSGAILHSRISNLFFGAYDIKHSNDHVSKHGLFENRLLNHQTKVSGGILEEKCSEILRDFFQVKRSKS